MIEIIKEAGTVLRDLPDLAIWILVGILFYKVFIIGGAIGLARFAITNLHDYLVRPKEVIKKFDLSGRFIVHDGTYERFKDLLDLVHEHRRDSYKGRYLHGCDVKWLREAVQEKIEREEGNE